MPATTRLPFIHPANQLGYAEVGGIVRRFKAGATLLIGDAVHLSAEDTVNKTIGTAALRRQSVGIVVGGQSFQKAGGADDVATASTQVGNTAATVNQWVLVLVHGIAWGVADAAVVINTPVSLGATTAGRLDDNTLDATSTLGEFLGLSLDTATTPGDKIKVLVGKF